MHIILDFDGTIVDSFNCVMEKSLLLADEFSARKIDREEVQLLRNLTSKEIIKHLNIPLYKIPGIIYQIRKHLFTQMRQLLPIPNMPEVLEKLHSDGFSLGILTSNSTENVKIWLEQHKLLHLFHLESIRSCYFSKNKHLGKSIKANGFDKSKVMYIGDETRDIEAAKVNDIKSVAVTWGYNSEQTLIKHEPIYIARKPEDILTICDLQP